MLIPVKIDIAPEAIPTEESLPKIHPRDMTVIIITVTNKRPIVNKKINSVLIQVFSVQRYSKIAPL